MCSTDKWNETSQCTQNTTLFMREVEQQEESKGAEESEGCW